MWKGCVWEGVEDRTELQHIDPHSIGHNRVSFSFSWAAQPGAWGSSLSGTCSHSSIFSQLVRSPTRLIPNCNCSIGSLRAHSAGCWLSLTNLASNWSGLQTNWLPVFTELYNSSHPFLLVGVTIAFIQPIHGQGYNSDIPRLDAPVIYISAFPILTARPGRKSIYNKTMGCRLHWLLLSRRVRPAPHRVYWIWQ